MAGQPPQITDDRYTNWIKDTLALLYVKEGLEVLISSQSSIFHGQLSASIGNQTCTCRWQAIKKGSNSWKVKNCFSGVCQKWLDALVSHHRFQPLPAITARNTDPRLWPSDTWEAMKVFQPNKGCQGQHSAQQADVAALLTLFNNCDHFHAFTNSLNLVDEILYTRNRLMHSHNFLVETVNLASDLQNMLQFLRSLTCLSAAEDLPVQAAIDKIEELRTKQLDLTLNRELELKALRAKQILLETEIKSLENTMKEVRTDAAVMASDFQNLDSKLTKDLRTLQQSLDNQLDKVQSLEQELTTQQLSTDDMRDDLKDLQHLFDYLHKNLGKIRKSMSDIKQRNAVIESANKLQESQISTLYHRQRVIKTDLEANQEDIESHESRLGDHHFILEDHDARLREHLSRLVGYDDRLGEHLSRLDYYEERLEEHHSRLIGHGTGLGEHHLILEDHSGSLEEHRLRLEDHGDTLEEQQSMLDDHGDSLRELHSRLETNVDRLGEHQSRLEDYGDRFEEHHSRLEDHAARLQSCQAELQDLKHDSKTQPDQRASNTDYKGGVQKAGSKGRHITDEDVAVLRELLKDHYRANCLTIPNPLVPENELNFNQVYVDTSFNILRERIDNRSGLVNVQGQDTSMTNSECKRLFFSQHLFKCNQIYVTGDAGVGKSTFCKHLVNLWCSVHIDTVSSESSSYDNINDTFYVDLNDTIVKTSKQQNKPSDSETGSSRSIEERIHAGSDSEGSCAEYAESDNFDKRSYADSDISEITDRVKENTPMKRMEDINIMSEFSLLFFIKLRDSPNYYDISDMIQTQILTHFRHIDHLDVDALLETEQCLIIIDGLDEWVCPEGVNVPAFANPGIPGRNWLDKHTVFVTMTRSWKLEALHLNNSGIDKHIQLVGFDTKSSWKFCNKLIKVLNRIERVNRPARTFWRELQDRVLADLHSSPVILTQLICLWFDTQELSKSQVHLYCNLLEMLLRRADKSVHKTSSSNTLTLKNRAVSSLESFSSRPNDKHREPASAKCCSSLRHCLLGMLCIRASSFQDDLCLDRTEAPLPECFSLLPHCQFHRSLLYNLCRVAFEALFDQKREGALVFESSKMKLFGVDAEQIEQCLRSGILSQNKVLGKWSISEKTLSFLHKTLQEFLAAVFIAQSDNIEHIFDRMKSLCNTIDTTLEMSKVWMFLSGIRPGFARRLLTDLFNETVFKNKRLQEERKSFTSSKLQQSIQTCVEECVEEAQCNGYNDFWLPLEDIVITETTNLKWLQKLCAINIEAIKSVNVEANEDSSVCQLGSDIYDVDVSSGGKWDRLFNVLGDSGNEVKRTVVVSRILCMLRETRGLQQLCKRGTAGMNASLECIRRNWETLSRLEFWDTIISSELSETICKTLTHVRALSLHEVKMTHQKIEELLSSLSQINDIRELRLWLNCSDHEHQCKPAIDLSNFVELRRIYLTGMDVKQMSSQAHCLEDVITWYTTLSEKDFQLLLLTCQETSVEMNWVEMKEDNKNPIDFEALLENERFCVLEFVKGDMYWNVKLCSHYIPKYVPPLSSRLVVQKH